MFICEIFMVILFDAAMFILILRLAHSMEEKNVKARMICITMGLGFLAGGAAVYSAAAMLFFLCLRLALCCPILRFSLLFRKNNLL